VDFGPSDVYGTRLSTVILIKRDGEVLFAEREMWAMDEEGTVVMAGSHPSSESQHRFQLFISSAS
jgi:uncharacterized protein with NRDE domain